MKTLSLGTWLDVELVDELSSRARDSLGEFWSGWDKTGDKTWEGYDRSPGLTQKPAPFLAGLLDFQPTGDAFTIQFDELLTYFDRYASERHIGPRLSDFYQPPLVIVPQSPGRRECCHEPIFRSRELIRKAITVIPALAMLRQQR